MRKNYKADIHAGGLGEADDLEVRPGDLLLRGDLRPTMGLCAPGCVLFARLRPLVRVAGGPVGMRSYQLPTSNLTCGLLPPPSHAAVAAEVLGGGPQPSLAHSLAGSSVASAE